MDHTLIKSRVQCILEVRSYQVLVKLGMVETTVEQFPFVNQVQKSQVKAPRPTCVVKYILIESSSPTFLI